MNDAVHYHILKTINDNPEVSQRELARKAGISLGRINYCIKALVEKGCIKAGNFKNSKNKTKYFYKLTPSGLEEKARVTVRFLRRKMEEYDRLPREIEELRADVREMGGIEDFGIEGLGNIQGKTVSPDQGGIGGIAEGIEGI